MTTDETAAAIWRKSTRSGSSGSCVEVAVNLHQSTGRVLVRDTKDHGTGPVLDFPAEQWVAFTNAVRAGQFRINTDLTGRASEGAGSVWIKSGDGDGVEVDMNLVSRTGRVHLRNASNTAGPALSFTIVEWQAFVEGVMDGELLLTP